MDESFWFYRLTPTDSFTAFTSWLDYASRMVFGLEDQSAIIEMLAIVDQRNWILSQFKSIGWEGDGNLLVSQVPSDDVDPHTFFVVKQSNNGSTFLASPIALPWLNSDGFIRRVFG